MSDSKSTIREDAYAAMGGAAEFTASCAWCGAVIRVRSKQ
jgi:hypothetical protein